MISAQKAQGSSYFLQCGVKSGFKFFQGGDGCGFSVEHFEKGKVLHGMDALHHVLGSVPEMDFKDVHNSLACVLQNPLPGIPC